MAPERDLEDAGLQPRAVHSLDLVGAMALFREERAERERDRVDQRKEVPKRDDVRRRGAIGLVLLRAVKRS